MKNRYSKRFILALLVTLSLCIFVLSGCNENGGEGSNNTGSETAGSESSGSKTTYDVKKVTYTFHLGDQDGAEMDVYSSDLTVKKYIVQPYSESGVDLFAGEIPPDNKCDIKTGTISQDDWNKIVDSINDNDFMSLPEELPKVDAMDGSTCYIEVEAAEGTNRSGGYAAGNGSGKEHERFQNVKSTIREAEVE